MKLKRGIAFVAAWLAFAAAPCGVCLAESGQPESAGVASSPTKFMINAIDVTGATKLDATAIERAVYPFEGPDRTDDDIEKARKALQDAYAAKGYEAVQIQTQRANAAGIVLLRVVEAPVGNIRVLGSRFHAPEVVRAETPSLVAGQPLKPGALQADLTAANRFPDRAITPSLRAGQVPGTVDVDLKVTDSLPLHGSIEIDNDHSPSTEPLRLSASVRYTNLWQAGHTITASYVVAPQDRRQTEVFSGSYSAPIIGSPWTFILYGYTSNSNVAALGGVNVLGKGFQIGARAVYRLPGDALSQSLTFGFDYKNFKQNIFVSAALAGKQPIEYIPLFGSYLIARSTDKSDLSVTLSITAGLRAIRKIRCFDVDPSVPCTTADEFDQFRNKDFQSNENFVHGNLELTYSHTLPKNFVAALKGYAQVADSHLVTNEQFAIGGLASVRGYLQSEGVGDDGYSGSLELRTPSFGQFLPKFVDEARIFGFVEGGQVRIRNPLPDETSEFSLASLGGGMRVQLFGHLSSEVSVAVPMINGPSTRKGDPRVTFSTKGEF